MPAEPTEDDQYRAAEVVGWEPINHPELQRALAGRVAQALADERESARAPFLALAWALDVEAPSQEPWDGNVVTAYRDIAHRIRAAAQEPTP